MVTPTCTVFAIESQPEEFNIIPQLAKLGYERRGPQAESPKRFLSLSGGPGTIKSAGDFIKKGKKGKSPRYKRAATSPLPANYIIRLYCSGGQKLLSPWSGVVPRRDMVMNFFVQGRESRLSSGSERKLIDQ